MKKKTNDGRGFSNNPLHIRFLDCPANFHDKNGRPFLVRCPSCRRENWAPNVAEGVCAWCGWIAPLGERDESQINVRHQRHLPVETTPENPTRQQMAIESVNADSDGDCPTVDGILVHEYRELERENERLRQGLQRIADWDGGLGVKWPMEMATDILSNALFKGSEAE